jgi:pyridoxal phosphate enzyme (YggS family)
MAGASVTQPNPDGEIRDRLLAVRARIAQAAARAGRDPGGVTLVAVSKTQPAALVRAAAEAGQTLFGENRIEEAPAKMSALADLKGLEWHMIGHVQSRKAREVAAAGFALVHSVDTLKLAQRLGALAEAAGRRQRVLLEINISGEASKAGFSAADRAGWPALAQALQPMAEMPGLALDGLMTMAPQTAAAEAARPYFEALRALGEYLLAQRVLRREAVLSMGMTDDFEAAIAAGATMVRIGRAIFGERHT